MRKNASEHWHDTGGMGISIDSPKRFPSPQFGCRNNRPTLAGASWSAFIATFPTTFDWGLVPSNHQKRALRSDRAAIVLILDIIFIRRAKVGFDWSNNISASYHGQDNLVNRSYKDLERMLPLIVQRLPSRLQTSDEYCGTSSKLGFMTMIRCVESFRYCYVEVVAGGLDGVVDIIDRRRVIKVLSSHSTVNIDWRPRSMKEVTTTPALACNSSCQAVTWSCSYFRAHRFIFTHA